MKINKKLFLIGIIVLIVLAGCGGKSDPSDSAVEEEDLDNLNESGMPIVEDEITLDIFAGKAPATADDWNDVMIFNEYEDMTNININWEMVPHEGLEEKRNLALASGTLPDAFHSANLPVKDLQKYGEQGVFIPLNDLIEAYAPNFKKIMEEHPEVEKAITYPDGNIYALPTLDDPDFLAMTFGAGPWVRQDWLDDLELDMPETTDEFYEYLKSVKDNDLIGDGQNNEVPFGASSIDNLLTWLKGSFGVGNRGRSTGYIDMNEDKDKVRFYPITDGYKEMLQYVNKLYTEGLIEKNIFSIENDQFFANASEGLYGSTFNHSPASLFGGEENENFTGGVALEGPNGDKTFAGLSSSVAIPGSFVITEENEHPAATMRWADYFYGDDGAELFMMGIEGETFEKTEDGEYEYVDEISNNQDGLNLDQAVAQYLTWPGGFYPSITKEKYFKGAEGSETSKKAAEKLEPDFIDEAWPAFTYTEDENKKVSAFGADIEKYVDEMEDKFITGDASFDEWDNYIKTLEDMNLDEYMEIQQAAYERYESN